MTMLATRLRRLLRRRPHLQRWYLVFLVLWMCPFGFLLMLGYMLGNDSPRVSVTPIDVYVAFAKELWPPHDAFGVFTLILWWSPVILAPFGLTRPDYKELY